MKIDDYNGLYPGERVKIIVDGVCITGEVISKSNNHKNCWTIRTYFHDCIHVDNMSIVSVRREMLYKELFKPGTLVELQDFSVHCKGVVVDSLIAEIDSGYFLYIPIVMVGGTYKKLCLPESLKIANEIHSNPI